MAGGIKEKNTRNVGSIAKKLLHQTLIHMEAAFKCSINLRKKINCCN
jgi:hypothetical protein